MTSPIVHYINVGDVHQYGTCAERTEEWVTESRGPRGGSGFYRHSRCYYCKQGVQTKFYLDGKESKAGHEVQELMKVFASQNPCPKPLRRSDGELLLVDMCTLLQSNKTADMSFFIKHALGLDDFHQRLQAAWEQTHDALLMGYIIHYVSLQQYSEYIPLPWINTKTNCPQNDDVEVCFKMQDGTRIAVKNRSTVVANHLRKFASFDLRTAIKKVFPQWEEAA